MSGFLQFQSPYVRQWVQRGFGPVLMALGSCLLTQCESTGGGSSSNAANVVVSVKEQKLAVYDSSGHLEQKFPVSTSKYGLNDKPGTYGTPLGMLEVVAKIGHGAPAGAVFKNRHQTGEVIKPDAPGRDPIVSRIMWLRGLESQNKNAYARCIYIHGTAEEKNIGRPASFGCIRMRSRDVIELFGELPIGSRVMITDASLPSQVAPTSAPAPISAPVDRPPLMLNPEPSAPSAPPPSGPIYAESQIPVVVAQNNNSGTVRTITEAANSSYQTRIAPDGTTVVSGYAGSPGVVLRSKKQAHN